MRSFVREQGEGPVVVLVHGVPTSSFLYRKLIPRLADQGLHAVAFDLPGLGLAERPADFDYSWSGLAGWFGAAIDALGHDRVHLVVHDIGGPIACEWAIRNPRRTLSITALNTVLDPDGFTRPWPMRPVFVSPASASSGSRPRGRAGLRGDLPLPVGIADRAAVSRAELYAYHALLRRDDGGRAFLKIMRGFELTAEKQRFFEDGLAERPYPTRVVWGEKDPALGLRPVAAAQRILGAPDAHLLPAKHFLQEDQAPAIAEVVGDLVAPLG